jgi:hypothetical protein
MARRHGVKANIAAIDAQRTSHSIAACGSGGDAALAAAAGVPLSAIHKGQCLGRRMNDAVVTKLATHFGVSAASLKQ